MKNSALQRNKLKLIKLSTIGCIIGKNLKREDLKYRPKGIDCKDNC